MNKTAEVVIVGGGVTGCSIAYNLAQKGCRNIVLIEKKYLTSGATGRCGAGVRMQWGTETNCLLSKYSVEKLEHLAEELDYPDGIEFKQSGYLLLAYNDKMEEQFRANLALQNRLGIPSRWVTPAEAREYVPYLNTAGLLGATFCQQDGHCNPFKTTDAYAKAAQRLGVEIMTYTEVTRVLADHDRITGVETSQGIINAPVVVCCAGSYTRELGQTIGLDIPVRPERHQILVTEPVEPMLGPMVMSFYHGLYCQQVPHGGFVMGIGDPNEPKTYNINASWHFLQDMAAKVTALLPSLANVRVVRQWAGLYDMTPDRQQILGSIPGVAGLYLACGFSGHGFMIAPMTGQLMAEHILGEPTTLPISMFDITRYERGELYVEPSVV